MSKEKKNMKVPRDYFEKRKNDFLLFATGDEDMIDVTKEAPLLVSLEKENGFSVPAEYFALLHRNVTSGTSETRIKGTKTHSIFYYLAAASVMLIFGYLSLHTSQDKLPNTDSILVMDNEEDLENVYAFLLEEIDQFSSEELLYQDAYTDFLNDEEEMNDEEIETIMDELSDELSIEDLEDIF